MAPKQKPLAVIRVTYRAGVGWAITVEGAPRQDGIGTQRKALELARAYGRAIARDALAGRGQYRGASLRWQRRSDRRWIDEATYPRSADPRRSRG